MSPPELGIEQVAVLFTECFRSFLNLAELGNKPLLAHYTSLDVLTKIMENEEIWLSNPLFMNDMQEMRFGMIEGQKEIERLLVSGEMEQIIGAPRAKYLRDAFMQYFANFEQKHALDVYVFCLSEHPPDDNDGRLSMWRGYGGNGNGAALVFNTDFVSPLPNSPLIFGKVNYQSDADRIALIAANLKLALRIIAANNIPDENLYVAIYQIFNLVVILALTTKHKAFDEEQEWRMIYMPDRDVQGILKDRLGYIVTSSGIQPKLKMKITPLKMEGARSDWTFDSILNRIILGPTQSTILAKMTVSRMLELNKKSNFIGRIRESRIPFRPI